MTSKLWPGGALIGAAMTPVIVALVKEALRKPVERVSSVTVRPPRPAPGAAADAAAAGSLHRERAGLGGPIPGREPYEGRGRRFEPPRGSTVHRSTEPDGHPAVRRPSEPDGHPAVRRPSEPEFPVYGRRPTGPHRWRLGLVTGLLAFLIAALALTLPELLFGGAAANDRGTTLFGGKERAEKRGDDSRQTTKDREKSRDESDTAPSAPSDGRPDRAAPGSDSADEPSGSPPSAEGGRSQPSPLPEQPAPEPVVPEQSAPKAAPDRQEAPAP